MVRRRAQPIDPATLPPPQVILAQIRRDMRAADREFAALERLLLGDKQLAGGEDQPSLFDPAPAVPAREDEEDHA